MRGAGKPPGAVVRAVTGWRASRISDPVARLRFLRRSVGDRSFRPGSARVRAWLGARRKGIGIAAVAALLIPAGGWTVQSSRWIQRNPVVLIASAGHQPELPSTAWLVERSEAFETWSNGLRIERRYETATRPMQALAYARGAEDPGVGERRSTPAGIVFHTTESHQADFEEHNAGRLLLIGESLLRHVQAQLSYHYLIDRFGRVWRVVREQDRANHAGYSVWADQRHTFFLLNRSFLGVAVEARAEARADASIANAAQIHSLRLLTGMLRSKYGIAAENCIAHAQVSVSPATWRLGYHTDWAAKFPFREIGLPDNYNLPPAAVWLFGFGYDGALVRASGAPYWKGLLLAEDQLRQNATARGVPLAAWRSEMQRRWRGVAASMDEGETRAIKEQKESEQ